MFRNDGDESLETAQNGTMNHNRARRRLVGIAMVFGRAVLQVELLRKLEVELYSGALEGSIEGVTDLDVDFGTVESAIAWVKFPLTGVCCVECLLQLLLEDSKQRAHWFIE